MLVPRTLLLLAALSFCALTHAAEAKKDKKPAEPANIVARIGDTEVITKTEFDRAIAAIEQARLAMMRQRGQQAPTPNAAQLSQDDRLRTLNTLVDSRIVLMMTREAGIKVDDAAVKAEVEKNKTNLPSGTDYDAFLKERGITEQEVVEKTRQRLEMRAFEDQKTKDITVGDDEVKEQFDRAKDRGIMDDFDVQHILIKAPQADAKALEDAKKKIDAVYARLKKGEDFASIAKEVSEDPGSKDAGGEYKGVRRGQMVPEFDKRMAAQKVGEISEPFTTQYGWHILRVNRHGTGELTPELSERIKTQILAQKKAMAMRKLVQEKRSTLNITINLPAEAPDTAPADVAAPKPLDSIIDAAS